MRLVVLHVFFLSRRTVTDALDLPAICGLWVCSYTPLSCSLFTAHLRLKV